MGTIPDMSTREMKVYVIAVEMKLIYRKLFGDKLDLSILQLGIIILSPEYLISDKCYRD